MLINNTHSATNPTVPTTNAGGTGASGTTGAASATGTSLGGTDFMTLLLAQLKHQDPSKPVDSNAFLSQLASLSQVQGIAQLNTSFSALSNSLASSQALQASSLLGHLALVGSSTATLAANGGTITGAVSVAQTTSAVKLNISNSSGVLVRQINLGAQPKGLANFSWNGTQGDGSQAPAGQYTLSAQVAGAAAGTAASTYVNGTVQSVTMGAGATGLTLNVAGLGSVPFSSVEQLSN
jgi:flagellar basal-body rod modification protein FlgD